MHLKCLLLHVNAFVKDLFCHTGKQCGSRSDCSKRSSLIWVHAVCYRDILNGHADDTADKILGVTFVAKNDYCDSIDIAENAIAILLLLWTTIAILL